MRDPIVLCVDDDPGIRGLYREMLTRNGYEAITVDNGVQALNICRSHANVDLALVDLEMPGMDGKELAGRLKAMNPLLPIMMVTGRELDGAGDCPHVDVALTKGVPIRKILDRIGLLLQERDLQREVASLR